MTELRKNDIYDCDITGFTSEGDGVGRIRGRAVFVPRALPGERWQVRVVKVNRTAVWGRGEALLSPPSPGRCEPICPLFGKCGGCAAMHMDYELELSFKLRRVNDALARIGGLTLQAETIVGADEPLGYRNKAIYNFAPGPVCGFYRPRSHDVMAAERCYLQPECFDRASDALLSWMEAAGVPAYDETVGRGVVRHLYLRRSGVDLLACIVAAKPVSADAAEAMRRVCPELTGVMLCVNDRPGNTVLTDDMRLLWGRDSVRQTMCGASFDLSPLTFFQVNTAQAEKLYALAGKYAAPAGKTVLDLYCGAGTIGLSVARDAARLIGNDVVPAAIENAKRNAALNEVKNTDYFCGDASAVARKLADDGLRPDVIITDPPRKGMDQTVLEAIVSMAPERVVYVSCDPATLARDLKRLAVMGYTAEKCTAVDMFPRTSHVETCVLLSKLRTDKYIEINLDMTELDLTSVESKATYDEIRTYVKEQTGLNVSNLYIAQIKQKYGIIERLNYNLPKSDNSRQPHCPADKEAAITDALKHFGMISAETT